MWEAGGRFGGQGRASRGGGRGGAVGETVGLMKLGTLGGRGSGMSVKISNSGPGRGEWL